MRSTIRRLTAAAIPVLFLALPARASAADLPPLLGKPVVVDVTNTAIADYHFDNRDDSRFTIPTQVNDDYGEWLDRLNLQARWWRLRLGVRLDAAVYFLSPTRDDVAKIVAGQSSLLQSSGKNPNDYTNDFYRELHSRYRRAIYPAKLFAGYGQPGIDVTVGDFYAQLGRGLVFSVRKIDELAVDTTVRGIKVVLDRSVGPVHLGGTLFGGQMNPLRVDDTSGRRLNGQGSPLFFGFPRGGDLETYDPRVGRVVTVTDLARPSYLEDSVAGGHVEAGTPLVAVGANAAVLLRRSFTEDYLACINAGKDSVETGDTRVEGRCASESPEFTSNDQSKLHNRIVNFSGSLSFPSILKHGDLYIEVAGQQMRDGHVQYDQNDKVIGKASDLSGYAVYGNASIKGGPVSISLEGKHYRSFFPLAANIDTSTPAFGAPEHALVTYSQSPTAEPIYTEIVGGGTPGVCVSGGRGRVDYRFNRATSLYLWLGRYASWSENPAHLNPDCEIKAEFQTNTWDSAVGTELDFEQGQSHARAWVGTRVTDNAVAVDTRAGVTNTFYHEGYVRYDLVKHLAGRFSLQLQGFHRRRFEPVAFDKPWTEGENYTALQWSPHLSVIFGYEYLAKDLCQPERPATLSQEARPVKNLCHFVSGGVQWRSGGDRTGVAKIVGQVFDTVSVFVGQRRAALRCVSGVCRQFPPFEGARLEITSRF